MTGTANASTARASLPAYPLVGILATGVGTFTAIELIPIVDYEIAGALMPAALAMSIGVSVAPAMAIVRRPRAFFRAENLLAICPVYWLMLDLIQGIFPLVGIERAIIVKTFLAIGLFAISIWLGSLGRPWKPFGALRRSTELHLDAPLLFRIILLFFILGFCRYAVPSEFDLPTMLKALTLPRFWAPWARGGTSKGLVDSAIDHLQYFGYLLPTLTVMLAGRAGWRDRRTQIGIACSLILGIFIAHGGNRRIIGVIFGAAIVLWVLEQARLNFKRIAILSVLAVSMLWFFQFMLEYRSQGLKGIAGNDPTGEVATVLKYEYALDELAQRNADALIRVDDNFLRLSQILQVFHVVAENSGGQYPFLAERPIVYALVRPIPRALWPGKPTDPGFNLGGLVGLGASLSSTVIADWYISFGMLGVLIGGYFYGRLATLATSVLERAQPGSTGYMVYSFQTLALVAGYRQLIELVLMSYMLVIWVGFSYFFLKRPRQSPELTGETWSQ